MTVNDESGSLSFSSTLPVAITSSSTEFESFKAIVGSSTGVILIVNVAVSPVLVV